MVKKQKASGLAVSFPAGIAIGSGLSVGMTVLMAMVLAWMMERELIRENSIGIASAVILIGSSAVGALVASGKIKHRRLLACMTAGAVYYLTLLCFTALFFGGQYQGMGITALTVCGGSAAAALLCLKGERRGLRRNHRKKAAR